MFSIDICMEFFKAKTYREALSIAVSGLNISKCPAGKGSGLVVGAEAISLASICWTNKELGTVIISQSGPKKHIANPGL